MNSRSLLLAVALALTLLPSALVAAALPVLRVEWHASASEMGWVVAAYQAGYVIGVLVLLPLTDIQGPARVMTGSVLVTAVASLLFPLLTDDVWTAGLLRMVAGVGLAGVYMPGVRLVAATARARRGLAVGTYVSAFYLGEAMSFWFTGSLLPGLGWRTASAVLGAASAIAVPLAVLASRDVPHGRRQPSWYPFVAFRDPGVTRVVVAYTGHAWELYGSRAWLAAFIAAVIASGHPTSTSSTSQGGQWTALIVASGSAGVWAGGWLSDRFGRARTAFAIAAGSGVVSLFFGQLAVAGWLVLVVVGCAYGVLMAADSGIYSVSVTELARTGLVGTAQATQASLGFLGGTLAPVVAGLVVDAGGGYQTTFLVAGIGSLIAAAVLFPSVRRPDRYEQ